MNQHALLASLALAALSGAGAAYAAGPEPACAPYAGPSLASLTHYEGLMHEHSSYSDGDPASVPDDYYRIAAERDYAFVGGSEHSDSLDTAFYPTLHESCTGPDMLAPCAASPSPDKLQKWNATGEQARARSSDGFLAIRGFEWTSDVFGHINVYFSRNFTNAKTDLGYAVTLQTFWDWFTRDPQLPGDGGSQSSPVPYGGGADGLAHFNHPHDKCHTKGDPTGATAGLCDWNDYTLVPAAVERMFGIEVYNDGNRDDRYQPYIVKALDKGWRLSFVGSEDEHFAQYAVEHRPKTVTIAGSLAEKDFKDAWLARRTYALSPGKHLRVHVDAAGHPMGSRIACTVGSQVPISVRVTERDGAPTEGSLRLFTNGGQELARIDSAEATFQVPVKPGRHWYFVRAHGADGQSTAYVAPVWIDGGLPVGDWLRGDLHVHSDHSGDGSGTRQGTGQRGPGNVSVADQIGQGVQNGLHWMPITDHRTYTQHYDPLWESAELLLIPGEEANGSPHSTVQAAVDWLVQGASRLAGSDVDRLQTSIWDAHAQGASWSVAHPDDGMVNDDGTPNGRASAIGMNTVETWNRGSGIDAEIAFAENRWTRGWRFGVVGASDSHFRELWATAGPGLPATGVFASRLTERGIVEGLQAGRTRIALDREPVAPAPTLEADFGGDGVYEALCGDEVFAPVGAPGKLRVRVRNAAGTTVLLYKSPGRSAGARETWTPTTADFEALVDVAVESSPTWYRVEVRGVGQNAGIDTSAAEQLQNGEVPPVTADQLRAVCSPIFLSNTPVDPTGEIPVPADIGTDDAARVVLGQLQQFAGFPDVAIADGVTHVVAEQHGDGATQVFHRRIDADGTALEPVNLADASSAARFPAIAARGNDVWVVWADEREGQQPRRSAIYLRHSADGGLTWLPEAHVRRVEGRVERPDIALLPDGRPVVVWQEITAGNPFDVMAQVIGVDAEPVNLSRSGKALATPNAYDTRSARYPASVWPSVAVAADGRVAVAFHDQRTDPDPLWTGSMINGDTTDVDNWQVLVMTRAPGTAAWGTPVAFGADDRADRHASVAFAADGTLVVAWDEVCLNSSGCNVSVLAARSTDGGATFSEGAPVAASPVGMGQYPKLGVDTRGAVRVVWYDSRSEDWRWRVMTAVLDPLGNWMRVRTLPSRGVNTWPATDGGAIAFASTRNAQRLQRDPTQQIVLLSGADAEPPNTAPTASLSPASATIRAGEAVPFEVGGSDPDDGDTLTYDLDFGDGTTPHGSASGVIGHTYAATGVYTATLTVTDGHGAADTRTATITVQPAIAGQLSVTLGTDKTGGDVSHGPLSVTFTASVANSDGTPIQYTFAFGDGETSTVTTNQPTVTHEYRYAGSYRAYVTAVQTYGSRAAASKSTVITTTASLSVGATAAASLSYTLPNGNVAPADTVFDTSGSTGDSWNLSFGDGAVQNGTGVPPASITHRYHAPGTYEATLSLSDGQGNTVAQSQNVTLVAVQQLTALLQLSTSGGVSPVDVDLDACHSIPANDGARIVEFTMDFGDGSPVVTQRVDATHVVDCNAADRSNDPSLFRHTYTAQTSTVFTPTLTVKDNASTPRTAQAKSANVTVEPATAAPSGGGGALGWLTLLPLLGAAVRRRR